MKTSRVVLLLLGLFSVVFLAVLGALFVSGKFGNSKQPIVFKDSVPTISSAGESLAATEGFSKAASIILPSVVSIDTLVEGENWFGETYVQKGGSGSGVVISKDGYILTNNHVIAHNGQAAARVIVKFNGGESEEATIVGRDPRSDLAVLKVNREDLEPASFGNSDKLKPGEWVIAAGSPLGFDNTISVGVVSSLKRPLRSESAAIFIDGIQTDAAINQGNSGGALCNSQGQLVGINTAIATTDEGSIGIGFAIPINRAQDVVNDIIKHGYARYGTSGINIHQTSGILSIQRARDELSMIVESSSEPPRQGVLIRSVIPGSPAYEAGINALDIIMTVDGQEMIENSDYLVNVSNKKPGDKLKMKIWSAGKERDIEITLADAGR